MTVNHIPPRDCQVSVLPELLENFEPAPGAAADVFGEEVFQPSTALLSLYVSGAAEKVLGLTSKPYCRIQKINMVFLSSGNATKLLKTVKSMKDCHNYS